MDEKWKGVFAYIRKGDRFTTFHLEIWANGHMVGYRRYMERNAVFEDNPRNYHYLLDLMVYQLDQQLKRRA